MSPIPRSLLTIILSLLINGAGFAGDATKTYNPNPVLTATVKTFGILDDTAAKKNWEWKGTQFDLEKTIDDFSVEVAKYPDRIKAIELY